MNDGIIFEWVMGGGLLAVVGFSLATYREIGKIRKDEESKRGRIYERLDEVKKNSDDKFTNKDVCKILHEHLGKDITDIKTDIKLLLIRKKNGDLQ